MTDSTRAAADWTLRLLVALAVVPWVLLAVALALDLVLP